MRLETGDADEGALNMTPLIDVVFMLLVFFLVATTFAKEEVEMDLNLPEASTGQEGQEAKRIVINVRRSGELVVDGRKVTVEALTQKLRAAARRNREQEVLIRGDTKAQFGIVARVLDVCRAAPLTQIAIGADPAQK